MRTSNLIKFKPISMNLQDENLFSCDFCELRFVMQIDKVSNYKREQSDEMLNKR